MKIFASRCLLYIFLISFFFLIFDFPFVANWYIPLLMGIRLDGTGFVAKHEWVILFLNCVVELLGASFSFWFAHGRVYNCTKKNNTKTIFSGSRFDFLWFLFFFFLFSPSRTFYPSIAQRQLFTKSPANLYFIICFSSTLFLCVYFVATCNWIGKCTEKRRRNTAERRQSLITPKVKLINRLLGFVSDTYIGWMGEPEKRNGRLGRLTCHGWHFGTCADIFTSFFAAANEFWAGVNFFHGGNTNQSYCWTVVCTFDGKWNLIKMLSKT